MQTVNDTNTQLAATNVLILVIDGNVSIVDDTIACLASLDALKARGVQLRTMTIEQASKDGVSDTLEDDDNPLVIAISDTFISSRCLELNKQLQRETLPLLHVTANANDTLVGPLVLFNQTACLACAKAQTQYFSFSFALTAPSAQSPQQQSQQIASLIASLWAPDSLLRQGGCFSLAAGEWAPLSNTLKNPNCPVCSRWSRTPKEVFYS
ncbi:hypothetical protein LJ739_07835 [Aestuariibacter halophilus]|uniref:Uncharacterized protein n=1 Tax=Fluctibacter halophilus TaxID=226011 RepID=A0ABS8G7T3_9ALTE|nr:hypothetical protein [Aestuariibacter halophilus]MCC2616146.1 hypothetical protein [Aestuariibacter halophilus]